MDVNRIAVRSRLRHPAGSPDVRDSPLKLRERCGTFFATGTVVFSLALLRLTHSATPIIDVASYNTPFAGVCNFLKVSDVASIGSR